MCGRVNPRFRLLGNLMSVKVCIIGQIVHYFLNFTCLYIILLA